MAPDEKCIGFDARKMWITHETLWDPERCARYLLRADVEHVFSTDELVWPSVFHTERVGGVSEDALEQMGLTGIPLPKGWIGPNKPLWESLPALKEHLHTEPVLGDRQCWLVAVTCIRPPDVCFDKHEPPYFEPTEPANVDEAWQLLGYDVSDGFGLSGLSNCGYSEDDFAEVPREAWAVGLNRCHLFDSLDDADQFRQFSDRRVREHAPFFVYGIYCVEKVGS